MFVCSNDVSFVLSPVRLCRAYPHYHMNGAIFGKKKMKMKMSVLIPSTTVF
jgi:hypothetical protein